MSKYKVYITDYDYADNSIEREILGPIGADVIGLQCKDGKGVAEQAQDADALMVQYANITKETIDRLPNLKVIARYGVGMDIVDAKAASSRGIVCTNVIDYCTDEVADHNISLVLMMIRRIPMFVRETRQGKWHWSETGRPVHRFTSMTIGTVGLGRIAQNMCRKLSALGFSIIAYDPYVAPQRATELGISLTDLDTLCKTADAIILQCPYTQETHHIIGKARLAQMKPGTVLVNCSRGKLVDNKALHEALVSGHLAAAGLDDLEDEPAKKFGWSPAENPLFALDNCFITPHVAYYSEESLVEARTIAARNVKAVLLGQEPENKVC